MVKLLLGLDAAPSPHDAADALAVAICHIHSSHGAIAAGRARAPRRPPRRGVVDQLADELPPVIARASNGTLAEKHPNR